MKKQRYSLSAEAPTMTRQKMTYRRRTVSDLWLPVAWSFSLSCVGGMLVFVITDTWKTTLGWGLGVLIACLLVSTRNLIFGGLEDVVQEIEEVTGLDLDGDGVVGQSLGARQWVQPVRLPVQLDEKGRHTVHFDMDITPQLITYCKALQKVDAEHSLFSEDNAAAYGVGRAEFEAFRDELMGEKKAIRWKNPKHHQSGYIFRDSIFNTVIDWVAGYTATLQEESGIKQEEK